MTSNEINLDIPQRIHFHPLEKQEINIKELLLQSDILKKVKEKDQETLQILQNPDVLRQIVEILSIKPSEQDEDADIFRQLQVICQLFRMEDNGHLLNAFLGEKNFKNSEFFLYTDLKLGTEQFGSETKLENIQIEETKQEKFQAYNSPLKTSIFCQDSEDLTPFQKNDQFYSADNVFIDFLDILKVQGIEDAWVQYHFNQIFSALLAFKPETVQSLVLEKHQNEQLLSYVYKYIGDYDISDVIEKLCFQLYEPSENIPIDYLKRQEDQIIKIINELLDLISVRIDEFDLKSLCRIIKNCLKKCNSHIHSQTFIKFSNIIFANTRVQTYLNILLTSKSTLATCEIAQLFVSALQLIQQASADSEQKLNSPKSFQQTFEKRWLQIIVQNLRRIKENKLEFIDKEKTLMTQFEQRIQMFGNDKLSIIDLIFEMVKLNDPEIVNEIIMQDYPSLIFSYLFVYDWNNLLHDKIYSMINYLVNFVISSQASSQYVESNNYILLKHLITHVEVYKKIRKAQSDDTVMLSVKKVQIKKPNMAFIIKIAESLERLRQEMPEVNQMLEAMQSLQREKWEDFCRTFLKKNLDLQKVKLGEYDKQKDMIQESSFMEGKFIKQSNNSKKLSERFRKNSGKDMSLFVLNPSNKKFSTSSNDATQKSEPTYLKNNEIANSQFTQMQRKKLIDDDYSDDKEKDEFSLCQSRKKLSISVERKSSTNIIQQNINQYNSSLDKREADIKSKYQNENENIQGSFQRKESDILDHLDDSWEKNRKRIITLGSSNKSGISYDQAQIQKNKLYSQEAKKPDEIIQSQQADQIMFKKKSENNQTKISSLGARLQENLDMKKKKFSYDENNSNSFLLSPRIFHKRKRVKSQPNLCSDYSDEKSSNQIFKAANEEQNKIEDFNSLFNNTDQTNKEKFTTIKIQSSCSIENNTQTEQNQSSLSAMALSDFSNVSPSKRQGKSQTLKQSNSLKENYFEDKTKTDNNSSDSVIKSLIHNRNAFKISSIQIKNKIFKSSKKQEKNSSNLPEQTSSIQKINEEENDSQSETEMSNSKSNSKSDSSSDLQKLEQDSIQSLPSNVENIDSQAQISSYELQEKNIEEQPNCSEQFWLMTKPKSDSQTLFRDFEVRDTETSFYVNDKKECRKLTDESNSISEFFSNNNKGNDQKLDEIISQKIEDITPNVNLTRRRKESIFEMSFLSPICQMISKDETENSINNDEYESSDQISGILSQRLSMNKSINLYQTDKNSNQQNQEYSCSQDQTVKQDTQNYQNQKLQQNVTQNDTTCSIQLENDKSKSMNDYYLNQESSFIL
ncbi:hypothetical protein TTHERM_00670540 (macronuclear) [Tetrahymena thermophila SB210]|uniref:Uncharacterized protein n=1 Tax=Tetrahymena thermophila (strain SB210) TaxID=312017 RepID=I7MJB7_TETTS|nr:hypothetical protein TTHERM_00670540 [Tetrahymena thermophila SB210]EAS06130.2 hypothetical protein TTHERM_00670540 [Tetrahymena thermophila SB210]|eukprot:XP_001026375.2 hypothetical protein TTHERM_00670540 [Tetrahymena thermophila SB210]